MAHDIFLRMALEEAKLGSGLCAPNPSVGAVAVKDNKVLATGFHQGPGKAHAEQMVLEKLPKGISGVTLYVTLEPCNHWGKTPPCVAALIKYGFKTVVYAFTDPNPIVIANNTPKLLKQNNIEVIHHPLKEIDQFYASYWFYIKHKRPFITAKIAVSLDGKIAPSTKTRILLSNNAAKQFTHENRWTTDWILTTAETITRDNPKFTARVKGNIRKKKIAILDRKLRLQPNAAIFTTAEKIIIFHDAKQKVNKAHPNCEYIPINVENAYLALDAIFTALVKTGAHDIWVEAGGNLFTQLHLKGLVNRTHFYLCPKVLGPDALGGYQDNAVFQRQHSVSWRILDDNVVLTLDWEMGK